MPRAKFLKQISVIVLSAVIAFLYTHQQIEIVKTSFHINKQNSELSLLLDQYRALVYNLSKLETPERIKNTLDESEIVLCMPVTERRDYLNIVVSETDNAAHSGQTTKASLLASIFDRFSPEAQAKVIE